MDYINNMNDIVSGLKIKAYCIDYGYNDNYFYYDMKLFGSGKIKDIEKYIKEISIHLKSESIGRIKPISNLGIVRIEFVKPINKNVLLSDILDSFSGDLPIILGKSMYGDILNIDLKHEPHMMIAGSSGSGKSNVLHTIIQSLMITSTNDFYLIDPKGTEFNKYSEIERMNVTDNYSGALLFLEMLESIMNNRYLQLKSYPNLNLNYIVCIIDEFSDLIMQDENKKFHDLLCKLAQKSRAARIHFVIATQRPSVNFISGSIKVNFPSRIACRVASQVDSRVILDESGAELLNGKGDAYLSNNDNRMLRFQTAMADIQ